MTKQTGDELQREQRLLRGAALCLGLCLVLAVGLGIWFLRLERRVGILQIRTDELGEESAQVETLREKAEKAQPQLLAVFGRTERVPQERNGPKWTAALRSVAEATVPEIALQDLHAQEAHLTPGACKMRLRGTATGKSARLLADRFRLRLDENLKQFFAKSEVNTRFQELEDEAMPTTGLAEERARFTIIATVDAKDATTAVATSSMP